ncbi:VCBS domain-containing protein, partial [Vibrio crassostreae]
GTFTYQVIDDDGALSNTVTSTIEITGNNDAPVLTVANNSNTEDELAAGISVDAATSNLFDGATDIDDVDSTLSI